MSTKEAKGFFTTADSLRMQTAALIREDEKMKTWTMPKINVEGFAANEYVAACTPGFPDNNSRYAMDFFNGTSLDFEGVADGIFNGVNDELISRGQLPSAFTNAGNNGNGKWYKIKTLYLVTVSQLPNGIDGTSLGDTRYFKALDNYDVYVSNKGVTFWAWPAGTAGNINPDDKAFS